MPIGWSRPHHQTNARNLMRVLICLTAPFLAAVNVPQFVEMGLRYCVRKTHPKVLDKHHL
jgi:hypothetical protein